MNGTATDFGTWPDQTERKARERLKHLYIAMSGAFLVPVVIVFVLPFLLYRQPMRNRIGEIIFELTHADILKGLASVCGAMIIWGLSCVFVRRIIVRRPAAVADVSHLFRFVTYSLLGAPAALFNILFQAPEAIANWIRVVSLLSVAGFSYGMVFHPGLVAGRPRLVRMGIDSLIALDLVAFLMLPLVLGYLSNFVALLGVAVVLLPYSSGKPRIFWRSLIYLFGTVVLVVSFQSVKSSYRQWLFGGEFRRLAFRSGGSITAPDRKVHGCNEPRLLWSGVPRAEQTLTDARNRVIQEVARRFRTRFQGSRAAVAAALQGEENTDVMLVAWWLASMQGSFEGKPPEIWRKRAEDAGSPFAKILCTGCRFSDGGVGGAVFELKGKAKLERWESDAFPVEVIVDLLESGHVWADFSVANRLVQARYREILERGLKARRDTEYAEKMNLAMDSGNALLGMGLLYEYGHQVGRDAGRSARLYTLTLEREPMAARMLGRLLLEGDGVKRDQTAALGCFALAARSGDEVAIRRLAALASKMPLMDPERARVLTILEEETKRGNTVASEGLALLQRWWLGPFTSDSDGWSALVKRDRTVFDRFDPNSERLRYPFAWLDKMSGGQIARVSNRINQLGNLAVAIRETPGHFAYLGPSVYAGLLSWFIPRAIWPDKPREISGLLIGRQLGLSKQGDPPMAWSMPVLVEAWLAGGRPYYVFSVLAITVGILFVLGLAFREGKVGVMSVGVVGLVTMAPLATSGLSATLGGTMQAVIFVSLLNWGMRRLEARRAV